MGLWDKIKLFFGGHGVEATLTEVEGQNPNHVEFCISDSVVKGSVQVTGTKEVEILAHEYEVYAECLLEDEERVILVAEDRHDKTTDIIGGDIKWPYTLKPGQVIEDSFCIVNVDMEEALNEMGIYDTDYVIDHPYYRFYVKFSADVKGTALDAESEVDLIVTP